MAVFFAQHVSQIEGVWMQKMVFAKKRTERRQRRGGACEAPSWSLSKRRNVRSLAPEVIFRV
jgi:hypothetical protein